MNKLSRRSVATAAAVLATAAGSLAWAATSASAATVMHNGPFPTCSAHDLDVLVGSAHGNPHSHQVTYRLDFTNNSRYACTLIGYPQDVIATDRQGRRLGVPAQQIPGGPSRAVVLLEGQTAHSQLVNNPQALSERACHPTLSAFLDAALPDSGQPVRTDFAQRVCSGRVADLSIGQVQPGT
jgi:hypothetical protein